MIFLAALAPFSGLRFLDNGVIRLGVDLNKGGSIVYLAEHGLPNMINSADLGRQIQLSFYSGPVPFEPNGKKPAPAWADLGWNPIQTGDYYGHPSRVVNFTTTGKSLKLTCIPMQWPLNNEPGKCTFTVSIRLQGRAVIVDNRLQNHRSNRTQFPARLQELPAIYTNAPWYRLTSYVGPAPFSGAPVQQLNNKPPASTFPWISFNATEGWAALLDVTGHGLGVIEPGCQTMSGGFAGVPGSGGPSDGPTGYISPNFSEILDANIEYRFQYTLIAGTLQDIRSYAVTHSPLPNPPFWKFTSTRRHWTYVNATDEGWPIKRRLRVRLDKKDPQMIGPSWMWPASKAPVLTIVAAYHTHENMGQVFWRRFGDPGFTAENNATFRAVVDGQFHTYQIRLSQFKNYAGMIDELRFDPEYDGLPGDWVEVKSIGFRKAPVK